LIKGWDIAAIGAAGGELSVDCRHCNLILSVEGNIAEGLGCRDAQAKVSLDNVALDLSVNSANGVLFGCVPEAFTDNLNQLTIKRDGFTADRSKWFLSEQAESAT
jgi:hypothetical protein